MRLQLWSPHQSSPTTQTTTPTPTPPHTTPKGHLRVRSTLTLGISHSQTCITQHTRTLDTHQTLIPGTQPILILDTNLTHDISRIRGTQQTQIPGFQATQTG